MTTTIKTTLRLYNAEFGTTLYLDILADGEVVGEAMVTRYHDADCFDHEEDCEIKYNDLEGIDIAKGHGRAAIEAMKKAFGRIVTAPDSEDSRRLYESIGGKLVIDIMDAGCLDRGFGVYEFC